MFAEVEAEVKSLHPYEVSEIVSLKATNVNVNESYMKWMLESTKSQK